MTDADLDFTAVTKPTVEQVRFVWSTMTKPSCRKVVDELERRGAKISFKTVARYVATEFAPRRAVGPKTRLAGTSLSPEEKTMVAAQSDSKAAETIIGGPEITPKEAAAIDEDIVELKKLDLPQLKEMQEKDRLIFNIMLMRHGARRAGMLVLIPKESSALMASTTEAADSLSMIPMGQPMQTPALNGHGGNGAMLDVTPNAPINPVSAAIAHFRKKSGAAA